VWGFRHPEKYGTHNYKAIQKNVLNKKKREEPARIGGWPPISTWITVPPKIQPLLNEFRDIVGDDLPTGLPPLRSISHQIDLIPGSSLQNKGLDQMTPAESGGLNR
jgi:hypothetical protein